MDAWQRHKAPTLRFAQGYGSPEEGHLSKRNALPAELATQRKAEGRCTQERGHKMYLCRDRCDGGLRGYFRNMS